MLESVAVIALDGVEPFDLGVVYEAFGVDRRDDGVPLLDFAVCAVTPGPVRTGAGFTVGIEHGLDRAANADLVAVPAASRATPLPAAVVEALTAAVDRGSRVLSVCTGAFPLGEAGLLDGRECTTHWKHARELATRFPSARVQPDVLYVDAGQVVTSAGTAAGLDACLHLWRQEHGAAVASAVARRMVVPPQREGGQAQYVARPVVECVAETLTPVLTWALAHLADPLDVDTLADRAAMSARTFARRFRDETGTTPHAWVTARRLAWAEELLERSTEPVEGIAARVGFGNAATLRVHFARARGVTPQAYRRQFAC